MLVSMIEYQCTRSGIRSLLTRSINNTPSNLAVDEKTGTFVFRSTTDEAVIRDTPVPVVEPPVKRVNIPPPPPRQEPVVVLPSEETTVVPGPGGPGPGPSLTRSPVVGILLDDNARALLTFLCPTNKGVRGAQPYRTRKPEPRSEGQDHYGPDRGYAGPKKCAGSFEKALRREWSREIMLLS